MSGVPFAWDIDTCRNGDGRPVDHTQIADEETWDLCYWCRAAWWKAREENRPVRTER